MNFDNIQSPLPPRNVGQPIPSSNSNIPPSNQSFNPPAPPSQPLASKPANKAPSIDLMKYLPWLGIVLLVVLIIGLVFKVIIPKLSNKPAGTVTLNYWGLWEESAVLQGLIDEFESENPGVKINYIHNEKTNYRTRLAGRLAKGSSEDSPDIFRIHSSWVPMFTTNLAPVPADVAAQTQLDNDFYDAYKTDLKLGSNYIGIPLMYDQLALFYNKDLLEAAQKTPPKTWWGLQDAAKQLTVRDANGTIRIAGAAMGTIENVDHWSDIIGLMMKQNKADPTAKDEGNKAKVQAILTFYSLFRSKDHVWDETMPDSTTAFANGKAAFYFGPSWRVFNIEDMNKNLKFEVTNVPQMATLTGLPEDKVESGEIDGQLTNDQWATYWFEGVNNKSKNQKEAWKFLQFLAKKESMEKFYTAASQIRSFGELYPRKSMAPKLTDSIKAKVFVNGADNGSSWYLSSRTFDDGLNKEMSDYFADAINGILNNNQTAEEVYIPLKNGVDQLVSKYKITKKITNQQ